MRPSGALVVSRSPAERAQLCTATIASVAKHSPALAIRTIEASPERSRRRVGGVC
jgi:hypothetical protein